MRLKLEDDLRLALERDELELYYQPLVDLDERRIVAVEGLVRWRHPRQGVVLPGEFMTVAEESGLIVPLGRWVLREAARHRALLVEAGWPQLSTPGASSKTTSETAFRQAVSASF